ncbi:MAG: putative blue copper protein [Ilumatobacteraceae bacterium]|nr:putative blue copper protein [Ilumatobacteraceae bacterium]MCU1390128.1 putative blue copper protein [Ilumatobacteraceae bacterium]
MDRFGRVLARAGALSVVIGVSLAGCGPDQSDVPLATVPGRAGLGPVDQPVAVTNAPDVATTGVVVQVYAIDNTFRGQDTRAKVGDTVQFTNRGKNDHDVLPQSGNDWGVHIAGFHPGDVYRYVFTTPGVYAYYCSIHGTNHKGMIGTITVTA